MTCQNGCQIQIPASTPAALPDCPPPVGPCRAPSYSRACMLGNPSMSPTRIERAARLEHLWSRTIQFNVGAGQVGDHSLLDVLFPAFTSTGGACLKTITLIVDGVAIPVSQVGIGGVWDFTNPGSSDWTYRVAIPCEKEALDISSTTGRCACDIDCEGCLYPAEAGGLFLVRARFPVTAFALGDVVRLVATGTHGQTPPCCTLPGLLDEQAPVAGPYPAVQALV